MGEGGRKKPHSHSFPLLSFCIAMARFWRWLAIWFWSKGAISGVSTRAAAGIAIPASAVSFLLTAGME